MTFVLANLIFFVILLVLLAVSGIFAGVETVLFSLSRHDRARMKKSPNRLEALAAFLLDNPRALLTSLIIGNTTCNIIFFVLSSLLLARLQQTLTGAVAADTWTGRILLAALAIVPPLLVTYMSDVFPKVIGSLNNTRIAPFIALPMATMIRLLWPVYRILDVAVMRPVHRLVGPRRHGNANAAFSTDELRELLETSEEAGVIDVSENELLQEVVRIADLKVRDVMTPRVDLVAYNIKDPPEKLLQLFTQSHLAKLIVFDGQIENILGLVYAKTVFLELGGSGAGGSGGGGGGIHDARRLDIRKMLQPVRYVPEQQPLDRLLLHFRQTRAQLALVVDEFGGIVGVVALEDVVEQMVGDIHEPHDRPAHKLERIGPDEYLVPGDLSMADWIDAFGAHVEHTHTATVAGLLAALLKRLPREGDEVKLAHLSMRVQSMRGRRVDKVRLKLLANPDQSATPVEAEMIAWQLAIYYAIAAVSLVAGALFSGSEIGFFSLSKVRLRLRTAHKDKNALLLHRWLQEPTYALEGFLILQNLASFAFAAAVTAILSVYNFSELEQTLLSIVIVLTLILVFADIMPKDLFHTHADRWMYPLTPLIKWLFRIITIVPLLPLVHGLSQLSTRLFGKNKSAGLAAGPRTEILKLFEESAATGVLTNTQQDLVQRALRLGRINVREVMIPWNRVIGAPAAISQDGFRALVRRYNVSRMPVLARSTTEVLGIIDVLDALAPRPHPPDAAPPKPFKLTDYVHPAMTLIGEQSVRSAITLMQRAHQTIAIVLDPHNRAIGLVTMKDLIEELVGDLENW